MTGPNPTRYGPCSNRQMLSMRKRIFGWSLQQIETFLRPELDHLALSLIK